MSQPARSAPGTDAPVATWALVLLTLVALAVRIVNLNGGLWVDEIDSLQTSFRPSLWAIVSVFPRDNRHPLYSVLAHLCILAFGEHPWSIRLPALVFGTATIPALYLLGSRVMRRREAFLAAALLALSYHHVWFSQNARGYAMLGFFAVVGADFLLRILEDGRRRWVVAYALAMALGTYTHLTMVFVAVGHAVACGIAILADRSSRTALAWRRLAAAFALSAVGTLLLYGPVLGDVTHYFTKKQSGLKGISTPSWAAAEAVRVLLAGLGGLGAAAAVIALVAGAAILAAGVISWWKTRRLVLGMFLAPAAVTIAGAAAARGTMYPRFFFSLAPYAVLIAVHGAFVLADLVVRQPAAEPDRRAARSVALATWAVGALIVVSALSLGFDWRYPKQDFDGARRWVEAHRAPGDVIATADIATPTYRDYFGLSWTAVADSATLDSLRARGRVWLVYTFPRYLQRGAPEIYAVTTRDCRTPMTFRGTVGSGDVYVCELGPHP